MTEYMLIAENYKQNKTAVMERLQARFTNAVTGKFLGVHFNNLVSETGINPDALEATLRKMVNEEGTVIRVGHPSYRNDEFTIAPEWRTPR